MHVFGSVLICPVHVQVSVNHQPLPEAVLHSYFVIATYDKVDLFKQN